jgi:hypothetical protein
MEELIFCIWSLMGDNAAELIALSALILAIWQGYVARLHNKLTVQPHLILETLIQWDEPQLSIFLENVGIGPAIIENYYVYIDGVSQDTSKKSLLQEVAQKLNIPNRKYGGGKLYMPDEAVTSGSKELIFKVVTKEGRDEAFTNIIAQEEIERLQIIIKYKSLYGKTFKVKLHPS